jgi:hypothetical protein
MATVPVTRSPDEQPVPQAGFVDVLYVSAVALFWADRHGSDHAVGAGDDADRRAFQVHNMTTHHLLTLVRPIYSAAGPRWDICLAGFGHTVDGIIMSGFTCIHPGEGCPRCARQLLYRITHATAVCVDETVRQAIYDLEPGSSLTPSTPLRPVSAAAMYPSTR